VLFFGAGSAVQPDTEPLRALLWCRFSCSTRY
jgi:hypothetical protein